ncbi:hypothetical protein NC651_004808 [Populus alba x Populus x berolinensis]|nr:hypothetical protein NC651_004808 [Populus alba x Populus x berolinensis]
MTQLHGYGKYKIYNPSRKGREMNTQFKVSEQNFILNLIYIYNFIERYIQ